MITEGWVKPIQRLNGSFFVYAKHSRVLGRRQVQGDDVGSLRFKIGIITGHVAFQPMRTDIGLSENPLNRVFADAEASGQFATRPMSGAVLGSIFDRRQDTSLQPRRSHRRLLSGMPFLDQAGDAAPNKSILPA